MSLVSLGHPYLLAGVLMASLAKRPNGMWRARYRDEAGKQHARHFTRKVDARRWLDGVTASKMTGTYVDPVIAKTTVREWCEQWLGGYASRRPSTVRQARTHIRLIEAPFGDRTLSSIRPSEVKAWTGSLQAQGYSSSYIYATYRRFAQVMGDAVHDGLIPRSPCSRRTSPGQGSQRPYVASTEQVWALYEAMEESFRPAVLLGAFVGLRTSEVAALRTSHVDFTAGVVRPEIQWPAHPLKSEASRWPVPVPLSLAEMLKTEHATVVANVLGEPVAPWSIERVMRATRSKVKGLPESFRFHDLWHYFASLLITSGADVKVVQTRLRHASAMTTLNTYGHLWPDADESARAAVDAVLATRREATKKRGTGAATSGEGGTARG